MTDRPAPAGDPRRGILYAGTSGFAYPGWSPLFYPAGTRPVGLLGAYAGRLDAVELHSTFYRRPSPAVVAAWVAATPEHFRFCPKAQRGASWGALRSDDPVPSVAWLTGAVEAFGRRLGPVLLSIPTTVKRDDDALARFLAAWPPALGLALELTHATWADDAVHGRLSEHGVALVATDTDDADEPDLRRIGDVLYVRLRRHAYDGAALARWAARFEPFLDDGLDVYAFFRHDEDGASALRAEALGHLVGT